MKKFRNTNLYYQGSYELNFLEKYYDGQRLPVFYVRVNGENEFYYEKSEHEKRIEQRTVQTA